MHHHPHTATAAPHADPIMAHRRLLAGHIGGARFDALRAGDQLTADGGHACLCHGETATIRTLPCGALYIACRHGYHVLRDHTDATGHLIGLSCTAIRAVAA